MTRVSTQKATGQGLRDNTAPLSPASSNIWEAIDARILNRVTDVVLAYRPKPKTKAAKKRARKKRKKKRD
jgi:hypothetical protein